MQPSKIFGNFFGYPCLIVHRCESSLIEAVVGVDVVHDGPGEGGVVVAGGEVAGVVGVALVGAGLEAEAGGLPGQGARRTQGPVCPAM